MSHQLFFKVNEYFTYFPNFTSTNQIRFEINKIKLLRLRQTLNAIRLEYYTLLLFDVFYSQI